MLTSHVFRCKGCQMAVLRKNAEQWKRNGERCAYCYRVFSIEQETAIIRANKESERPADNNSHE